MDKKDIGWGRSSLLDAENSFCDSWGITDRIRVLAKPGSSPLGQSIVVAFTAGNGEGIPNYKIAQMGEPEVVCIPSSRPSKWGNRPLPWGLNHEPHPCRRQCLQSRVDGRDILPREGGCSDRWTVSVAYILKTIVVTVVFLFAPNIRLQGIQKCMERPPSHTRRW